MLTQFRGALKGVVAWFIIALMVLAFAFFGVPDLRNFAQSSAVQVGKTKFSATEIQQEFNRELDNRRRAGQQLSREEAIEAGVLTQTLNNLKARTAVQEDARELNLTATNDMIRAYLQSLDGLKNPSTGEFDQIVLEQILRQNNISITQFREDVRSDLVQQQFFGSIASPMVAPAAFVEPILLRSAETREISYLTLAAPASDSVPAPTEQQLRSYYDANAVSYTDPEYRTFQVVLLTKEDFEAELDADEEDIRQLYELRKSRLDIPETRTVVQIPFPNRAEAEAALAKIETGTSLEEIAAERSFALDALTFTDVSRADLTDAGVAEAVFSAEEGALVGPVTDLFGNHVIAKVLSVTPGQETSYEEVREDLISDLLADESTRALLDAIEVIESARDVGSSIPEAIAEIEQATLVTYGPVDANSFTENGAIINDLQPEVLDEAFALDAGDESSVVPLDDGSGYFVLVVEDIIPPTLNSFEAVRESVERSWRMAEARDQLSNREQELRQRLAGNETMADLASLEGLDYQEETVTQQSAAELFPVSLVRNMFLADTGGTVSGVSDNEQTAYIVAIEDVSFPPLPQADLLKQFYGANAGQVITQQLSEAYISALQEDVGVKQNDAQLAQIFGLDTE